MTRRKNRKRPLPQSMKSLTESPVWAALREPLVGWLAKKTTRQAAVDGIARRYREFVDIFEMARAETVGRGPLTRDSKE